MLVVSSRSISIYSTAATRSTVLIRALYKLFDGCDFDSRRFFNLYNGFSTFIMQSSHVLPLWYSHRLWGSSSVSVNCSWWILCPFTSSGDSTFCIKSYSAISRWSVYQFPNVLRTEGRTLSKNILLRAFSTLTDWHVNILDQNCWASTVWNKVSCLRLHTSLSRFSMLSPVVNLFERGLTSP